MAECETDSAFQLTTTAASKDGFSSRSEAEGAMDGELLRQAEEQRRAAGKHCPDRTCPAESGKDCVTSLTDQNNGRYVWVTPYLQAGQTRYKYDIPAGATIATACRCVSKPAGKGGIKKRRHGRREQKRRRR